MAHAISIGLCMHGACRIYPSLHVRRTLYLSDPACAKLRSARRIHLALHARRTLYLSDPACAAHAEYTISSCATTTTTTRLRPLFPRLCGSDVFLMMPHLHFSQSIAIPGLSFISYTSYPHPTACARYIHLTLHARRMQTIFIPSSARKIYLTHDKFVSY